MAQTVNITGTVTDATGASGNFSIAVTLTSTSATTPLSVSASVNPASAPAGTSRILRAIPTGGTTPYTFATPTSTAGIAFTAISSSPGTWSFVY